MLDVWWRFFLCFPESSPCPSIARPLTIGQECREGVGREEDATRAFPPAWALATVGQHGFRGDAGSGGPARGRERGQFQEV